jgi:amino acid permease
MRFIVIVLAVALLALIGLFVYGQMLEPQTRQIEQQVPVGPDA